MYGLNNSTDFQFIVGTELLQLCIGLNQVVLHFTEQVTITAECIIRVINMDGSASELSMDEPEQSKQLACLLGRSVNDAVCENDKELKLTFSGGFSIFIVDSNEDFESFSIIAPGKEVIV